MPETNIQMTKVEMKIPFVFEPFYKDFWLCNSTMLFTYNLKRLFIKHTTAHKRRKYLQK